MKFRKSPRYHTAEKWKEFIADWKMSGLSKEAYCRQKNIGPKAFHDWYQKLLDPEFAKRFGTQGQLRPRYTADQWKEFVEDWGKSNLSKNAYCRKKGLSASSFSKWHHIFTDPELAKRFSEKGPSQPLYTPEQWKEFVEDWRKSGLSKEAYCRQKNYLTIAYIIGQKKTSS